MIEDRLREIAIEYKKQLPFLSKNESERRQQVIASHRQSLAKSQRET